MSGLEKGKKDDRLELLNQLVSAVRAEEGAWHESYNNPEGFELRHERMKLERAILERMF